MTNKASGDKKVYLLDDNDDFRESAVGLLEAMGYRVEAFANPAPAIERFTQIKNDVGACLLLDIQMPTMSGLDVYEVLNEKSIALPVIFMTAHADVPIAVTAMSMGALTFLEKPLDQVALVGALVRAFSSPVQLRRSVCRSSEEHGETRVSLGELTPREAQILQGILADQGNRQMALELNISVKTVELYRSKMMTKLKAKNAAHLVRMVMACERA